MISGKPENKYDYKVTTKTFVLSRYINKAQYFKNVFTYISCTKLIANLSFTNSGFNSSVNLIIL